MGNCQATDAAAVLLQHPGGRVERMYWPLSVGEVMRSNPGYYVALIMVSHPHGADGPRVTHVRLLRAKDTLVLGQVYRLVTSQEVIKGLRARKQERLLLNLEESRRRRRAGKRQGDAGDGEEEEGMDLKVGDGEAGHGTKMPQPEAPKEERQRPKMPAQAAVRARQWRPSLQSISEAAS